uniref:Solute carrier family 19 member 3a n=1 Tax=Lepisosteus oculatus TaxID=7918 RepID=W5MTW3_LEPOC|nr:PREDICTED: thiamine transporter 2-like [Lepisosteus oculatus]
METLKRLQSGWCFPTVVLCVYGFFTTVKPIEPFLTPYLTGPDKNLTTEEVTNKVLPVWTYSYLIVLIPAFLATDYLRYKPVIILQGLNLIITTLMLLWAEGVLAMQFTEFFYGMVTAMDVAYFSYIYSVVELEHYQKVTSYCRSVQLVGYTVGSVLGQVLVTFSLMSYFYILVMTLVFICIALLSSCFLPMPKRSMFFHRKETLQDGGQTQAPSPQLSDPDTPEGACQTDVGGTVLSNGKHKENKHGFVSILAQLWFDFLQCYSTKQLVYWSLWWALATCGYNQTVNYVQVLWEHIEPSQNFTAYNGGVEAVSSLFGAASAYAIGFTEVDWTMWGELALGLFSALSAAALYLMTFTDIIWVCYTGYTVFKALYMLLITIAMFQIAAHLSMERYALIFGANNFGALVLQTIVTVIVVDSRGLGLDIIPQFIIYGSYFAAIAALFLLRGIYTLVHERRKRKMEEVPKPNQGRDAEDLDGDNILAQRF